MQTLTMPEAVKGMTDATILRWLKQPGQAVAVGEPLVEVQTRRDRVEVQSPAAGRLAEILAAPGAAVAVGQPIARLASQDEKAAGPAGAAGAGKSPGGPSSVEVIPILMPQVGNTMEEGTIVAWRVKEGLRVDKGQVLFEVETDKAVVEVQADHAGRVARIVVQDGQTVPIFQPVAYLAERDEDLAAFLSAQHTGPGPGPTPPPPTAPAPPGRRDEPAQSGGQESPPFAAPGTPGKEARRAKVSPAARKLADAYDIDLAALPPGRGPQGRILSTDVSAGAGKARSADAGAAGEATRVAMTRIRKAIAGNLTASKQTVPHFYIELTIDAGPMMDFYRQRKARYPLSVNDILLHACGRALMEFPAFRRRVEGEQYVEFASANVGLAVALEDGLVVPVVTGLERMTLEQTAVESRRLVEAARAGRVENAGKGVMTISNLGMFGAERFSAIINPPEASILAVGAVRQDAVVSDGAVQAGRLMTMTLSCDHRVVDGVMAAKFLARIKELLEKP